ncbi:MAG: LacI family DNA-binding transcriptional regulator [Prolixibacteraceae bacterium]|jgi:LacI family transcriptional regulator|nr:LacI family DNA-binding transcriptional regulator [Prolixibacteraceae bacterium]
MPKRISLKDIAVKVGVSTAAVSYVLNGLEKEKRVGPDVVRRVRQVAKELNYTPNQIARSLRKGTTNTIGLIVADIANPFFGHLARIIEDEAIRYGYTVIFGSSDEDCLKSESLLETFMDRQVDGFIIVPSEGCGAQIELLTVKKVPVVLVDRYIRGVETNFVMLDNYDAVYKSVRHLISKGYKRVAMVAYRSCLIHMEERKRGYIQAMGDCGPGPFSYVGELEYNFTHEEMEGIIRKIITEYQADALLFATNALSVAGLYAIRELQVRIPDEIAVIGFDGSEVFDFFDPPLSFIRQPLEEMGKTSVQILLDQIRGEAGLKQVILKHQLVLRESSG